MPGPRMLLKWPPMVAGGGRRGRAALRRVFSGVFPLSDALFGRAETMEDFQMQTFGTTGPLVFFLHGWPDTSSIFSEQVEALSRDHRCVAVTNPLSGHPRSRVLGPSWPEMYRGFERLVEKIRQPEERISIVAHDWGTMMAVDYERKYGKQRVDRLVLLDVFPDARKDVKPSLALLVLVFIYQVRPITILNCVPPHTLVSLSPVVADCCPSHLALRARGGRDSGQRHDHRVRLCLWSARCPQPTAHHFGRPKLLLSVVLGGSAVGRSLRRLWQPHQGHRRRPSARGAPSLCVRQPQAHSVSSRRPGGLSAQKGRRQPMRGRPSLALGHAQSLHDSPAHRVPQMNTTNLLRNTAAQRRVPSLRGVAKCAPPRPPFPPH